MRKFSLLLIALSTIILSSCLTLEEKITLNKDGSGTYSSMIDLSEMLSNPFMKMALEEQMQEEGEEVQTKMDSAINLYETLAPANPQWTAEERAIVQRIDSRMVIDMDAGEGGIFVTYPFASTADLERTMTLLANAKQPEESEDGEDSPFGSFAGDAGMMAMSMNSFSWKKGKFTRNSTLPAEMMDAMGGEDSEDMDMVRMMFGDAKITYVMEFPGKVKKVKGFPGHKIEGKSIIQEFPFTDLFDNPENVDAGLDGEVVYKK